VKKREVNNEIEMKQRVGDMERDHQDVESGGAKDIRR
jgi:hypothetical protein